MQGALSWLMWITPVVAIAGIVWYSRRKIAAREAASAARLNEFLEQAAAKDPAAPRAVATVTPASVASSAPARINAAPRAAGIALRERLLTPPQTALYYLLKSGLPDHEVLAQVSVAALIELPGVVGSFEAEARHRRLAGAASDFVVCDKAFKAVAVVQCGARTGAAADTLALVRAGCESAGLRWVAIAPEALPRRETVRAVVLGA